MKITAVTVSERGLRLAELLRDRSGGKINITRCETAELPLFTAQILIGCDALILICTVADAVRALSAIEYSDICSTLIIQSDEYAKYVVPMAPVDNGMVTELAKQVAGVLGAVPVLSQPEQLETFSIDKWASSAGLRIANPEAVRRVQEKLSSGAQVHYDSVFPISGALPPGIMEARDWQESDFTVSYLSVADDKTLLLVPPVLALGIDCSEEKDVQTLAAAFNSFLEKSGCHPLALGALCCLQNSPLAASAEALCRNRNLPFKRITPEQLAAAEAHFAQTRYPYNPDANCEKSAVLGMGGTLLVRRFELDGIGFALAVLEPNEL